jgi:hypothetical protein
MHAVLSLQQQIAKKRNKLKTSEKVERAAG